jgi:hypothetical protein
MGDAGYEYPCVYVPHVVWVHEREGLAGKHGGDVDVGARETAGERGGEIQQQPRPVGESARGCGGGRRPGCGVQGVLPLLVAVPQVQDKVARVHVGVEEAVREEHVQERVQPAAGRRRAQPVLGREGGR